METWGASNTTDENWKTYREKRNGMKKVIKDKKTEFNRKIVSSKNVKNFGKAYDTVFLPQTWTRLSWSIRTERPLEQENRKTWANATNDHVTLSYIDSLAIYDDVLKCLKRYKMIVQLDPTSTQFCLSNQLLNTYSLTIIVSY